MDKYRVLKNNKYYILQKKWRFGWMNATTSYGDYGGSCDVWTIFPWAYCTYDLKGVTERLEKEKKWDQEKLAKSSKYKEINLPTETSLYKVLNG